MTIILLICLLIFTAYLLSYENIEIIKILGLFIAAAYKLGPSASKILNANQNFRLGKVILENIYSELNNLSVKNFFEEVKNKIQK